jgi:hypothetical protein
MAQARLLDVGFWGGKLDARPGAGNDAHDPTRKSVSANTKTMMVTGCLSPPSRAGGNTAEVASPSVSRLYGDRTKIVALGNFRNCISGCDMEMEVRQQKMDEIIGAVHVPRGRAEREGDLTLGR